MRARSIHNGVAALEAVGTMGVLLMALIGSVAISTWVFKSYALTALLEEQLRSHQVQPFKFNQQGKLDLNSAVLHQQLNDMATELSEKLKNSDLDRSEMQIDSTRYLIKIGYAIADFSPLTGEFLQLEKSSYPEPFYDLVVNGALYVPQESLEENDLTAQLIKLAKQGAQPLSDSTYLDRTPFLVATIYFKSIDGFTSYYFSLQGKQALLADSKVLAVRTGLQ